MKRLKRSDALRQRKNPDLTPHLIRRRVGFLTEPGGFPRYSHALSDVRKVIFSREFFAHNCWRYLVRFTLISRQPFPTLGRIVTLRNGGI
jgi:hypothetical protein